MDTKTTKPSKPLEVYGIFEGGGVKGTSLIGAIAACEEAQISFRAVAGTSAGAIVASLLATGHNSNEIYELMLDKDYSDFKDPVYTGWFSKYSQIYKSMGVYKGEEFRKWLNDLFEKKLDIKQPTMEDLKLPLTVYASNLYQRKIDWFKGPNGVPSSRFLQVPIADAVRASMSIPGFFTPKKINNLTFVDGGMLSNFPALAFEDECKIAPLPVIGFRTNSSGSGEVDNAWSLLTSMVDTIVSHNSNSNLEHTINLNTFDVGTFDFDISKQRKSELYDIAKHQTAAWLATTDLAAEFQD